MTTDRAKVEKNRTAVNAWGITMQTMLAAVERGKIISHSCVASCSRETLWMSHSAEFILNK